MDLGVGIPEDPYHINIVGHLTLSHFMPWHLVASPILHLTYLTTLYIAKLFMSDSLTDQHLLFLEGLLPLKRSKNDNLF
jgi:hypothetical protein